MTYRELTRKLRRLGCQFDQQGRGDHEIWINPGSRAPTTIPNWGGRDGRDLGIDTVEGILRDLGNIPRGIRAIIRVTKQVRVSRLTYPTRPVAPV